MNIRTCFPRPVRYAVFAIPVLLSSTFVIAHSPAANDTDPVAAAQWRPGAPQVQLQGQIEIVHQDFLDGHGKFVYTLKQSDGTRVPMHFVKNPPTHVLTGDHITATGEQSSSGLILYSGGNVKNTGGGSTSGGSTSSIPVPNTFGSQSVLVILVNFQDDVVQPYTISDAQSAFFTAANSFIQENSYQQTSLTGDVIGWFTLSDSVTSCNLSQIAGDAQAAATASGVNLNNYSRYVYAFPYNSVCGWAGASNVGGTPSQSWINGATGPGGTTLNLHVINHELGHAFGLWHSHSLDCGTSATVCSSGTVAEYGDRMDTMGTVQGASPHYNSFQKEQLGWLGYGVSPSIQTVTSSGTYTIYPYELAGPGPNALKVLQSTDSTTGAKTWYYLEARQAVGSDAFLTNSMYYTQNETSGVLFHLGTDVNGNSSELLDMTPATPTNSGWWDMSLVVGNSYQDSTAGVTFTPTAVDSTGATLQITMNGSSCILANPSLGISPSQSQNVTSGTPVTFAVTVTDNDTSSCSPATFDLAGMLPSGSGSGWAGLLSTATLSLSPGKGGSATLTVTSPVGTADGSYNVVVSATNTSMPSYGASATAAYVINTAPLNVSLTTNQSSYLPGQTVGIYVTMLYGTAPDVGASVSVTVSSPNGKLSTLTGTTGSNGVAALNYTLRKNAPAGTYAVQYGTTVTGAASVMGASTSFTVK
jgi:gametolysin peptidase M11